MAVSILYSLAIKAGSLFLLLCRGCGRSWKRFLHLICLMVDYNYNLQWQRFRRSEEPPGVGQEDPSLMKDRAA